MSKLENKQSGQEFINVLNKNAVKTVPVVHFEMKLRLCC